MPTTAQEYFEAVAENVQGQDLRFEREWFFIASSILAWVAFWDLADRQHENPHVHMLAWMCVFVAIWVACIL